ncbi:MAG: hypothetical protein LBW85_14115, partial [Deltaproteobacteria bacterium]|nr:hypothetical protein [Deltaproteobacteria bacterium]
MYRFRIPHSADLFQGPGDLPFADLEAWLARNGARYLWRAISAVRSICYWGMGAAVECLGPEAFLPDPASDNGAAAPGEPGEAQDGTAASLVEATAALRRKAWSRAEAIKYCQDPDEFGSPFLRRLYAARPRERDRFCGALCRALRDLAASGPEDSDVELKFRRASEALGLSEGDREMARLLVCLPELYSLDNFLTSSLKVFLPLGRCTLARILGRSEAQTEAIFRGKLKTMDLIGGLKGGKSYSPYLTPIFYELMNSPDGLEALKDSGPQAGFIPAHKPRLRLED